MVTYIETLKQGHHTKLVQYWQENFHGTVENHEKRESLAQRIFPHLQYIFGRMKLVLQVLIIVQVLI